MPLRRKLDPVLAVTRSAASPTTLSGPRSIRRSSPGTSAQRVGRELRECRAGLVCVRALRGRRPSSASRMATHFRSRQVRHPPRPSLSSSVTSAPPHLGGGRCCGTYPATGPRAICTITRKLSIALPGQSSNIVNACASMRAPPAARRVPHTRLLQHVQDSYRCLERFGTDRERRRVYQISRQSVPLRCRASGARAPPGRRRAIGHIAPRACFAGHSPDDGAGIFHIGAFESHAGFVKNHQQKVERIAVIAAHDWQHWLIGAVRIFLHPEARAYDKNHESEALQWIVG